MTDDVEALRHEVEQLRGEVVRLRDARLGEQEARPAAPTSPGRQASRRALLGAAVAATAGATLAGGRRADAANGDALRVGELREGTETTELKFPGSLGAARPRSHVFVAQDGAWSTPASPTASVDPENGTRASIAAFSGNHAMHGFYGQTNSSLDGGSGGRFHGEGPANYGLQVSGRRATMRLRQPSGDNPAPPARFDLHQPGELTFDDSNDLWLCVSGGRPGSWRKLAGPASAGAFHPIAPARVYDSRLLTIPGSGPHLANTARTVGVRNGYDHNGTVSEQNVVPAGATAIAFNVTVDRTTAGSFLSVTPGDVDSTSVSTLNWTSPGSVIANAGIVGINSNRQIKIFAGPFGSFEAIVDVTGYFV